jgi:SPP1 family predicted phage head-tail adaptor
MKVGSLRHRVTVQSLVETVDQYGQPVQNWDATVSRWAAIRTPNGRDKINADQLKVELTHILTLRYVPGLDVTQRLVFDGRVFNITYVINKDERNREQEVYCNEEVGIEP